RLLQQLAGEHPVVLVETLDVGQHFLLHELERGLPEHPLLVGEVLADVDVVGCERRRQELAAGDRRVDLSHMRFVFRVFVFRVFVLSWLPAVRLTASAGGSISLASCPTSTNCSSWMAVSPSSPAARAVSVRKWRRGSPRPVVRSCSARAATSGSRRPSPSSADAASRSKD